MRFAEHPHFHRLEPLPNAEKLPSSLLLSLSLSLSLSALYWNEGRLNKHGTAIRIASEVK